MIDPLIQFCLLGSFALFFALSATEKLRDQQSFVMLIQNYQVVPEPVAAGAARLVMLLEITCATALITTGYLYGVWLAVILLAGYAAVIWINLVRGRTHIDCGCLGSEGEGISYFHVLRNAGLIALVGLCLLPVHDRPLFWLDYLVIALALFAAILLYATGSLLLSFHMNQRLWWQ